MPLYASEPSVGGRALDVPLNLQKSQRSVFKYSTTLKLRDTDAAGVAFFASYFAIAHDAYETWVERQGVTLKDWLGEVHLPIVHAQSDYRAPLRLGDAFTVELTCRRVGARSFTLNYIFRSNEQGDPPARLLAQLETVHVAVSQETMSSVSLPHMLATQLEQLRETQEANTQKADTNSNIKTNTKRSATTKIDTEAK